MWIQRIIHAKILSVFQYSHKRVLCSMHGVRYGFKLLYTWAVHCTIRQLTLLSWCGLRLSYNFLSCKRQKGAQFIAAHLIIKCFIGIFAQRKSRSRNNYRGYSLSISLHWIGISRYSLHKCTRHNRIFHEKNEMKEKLKSAAKTNI